MKLRNKKTGEIATVEGFSSAEGEIQMTYTIDNDETKLYLYCTPSLTTFNEEWEDYHEEPKEDYIRVIESFIHYVEEADESFYCDESVKKFVEKLKAWKRLKDKGFRFTGYTHKDRGRLDELEIYCQLGECPENIEEMDDVHLLFGGEE